MNVIVKRSVLESLMKQIAENRSIRSVRIDQIAGDNKPVIPDEQMATQLSQDKVPVEDPDFMPVNKIQLKRAASQIADKVEPSKVQKFYSSMKNLLRKDDKHAGLNSATSTLKETDIREAKLKKYLGDEDGEEGQEEPKINQSATNTISYKASQSKEDEVNISSADNDDIEDANNAAGDIINIALNMLVDPGEMITIIDPKTKEKATFGQSMSKTTDDIDKIMKSLFSKKAVEYILSPLLAVSKKLAKEKVRSELMKMLAKRPDLNTLAIHFSNGILDMTAKNSKSQQEFEKSIDNIVKTFSISSSGSAVSVKIPGSNTPYRVEVPKDIDYIELDKQIKSALSTKKTTFWDEMQAEGPDAIKLAKAAAKAEAKAASAADKASSEAVDDEEDDEEDDVESLRNKLIDFAFIFGKKEKDSASPIDLSEIKIENYIKFIQSIYEDVIRDPGRENIKNSLVNDGNLDPASAVFIDPDSAVFTSNKILNDDFFVFLQDNIEYKDLIMNIIKSYIKLFIESDQFKTDFPEIDEFKDDMSKIIASKITKTEHRLGLRDVNSISSFLLGFDIVAQELTARCVKYITNRMKDESSDVGLDPKIISKLEKLLYVDDKTRKVTLLFSREKTMDEIKSFSEISNYTDTELKILKQVSSDFSKTLRGNIRRKVFELIEKIQEQFENKEEKSGK